jgi:DNA-directed RNA polymerase subunit RPC12/RpoP
MNTKKHDPLESTVIRDKEIWTCTVCGEKVFASDIALFLMMTDRVNRNIPCSHCGHVDEPMKKRTYRGNLV